MERNHRQWLFFILSFLAFIFLCRACSAQIGKSELALLGKEKPVTTTYETKNIHYKSKWVYLLPTHLISKGLMSLYRNYISEQISAQCVFDVSCSVFALNSINQYGFIKGMMLAADRLTRCGLGTFDETEPYLVLRNEHKIIDHPEFYKAH